MNNVSDAHLALVQYRWHNDHKVQCSAVENAHGTPGQLMIEKESNMYMVKMYRAGS